MSKSKAMRRGVWDRLVSDRVWNRVWTHVRTSVGNRVGDRVLGSVALRRVVEEKIRNE